MHVESCEQRSQQVWVQCPRLRKYTGEMVLAAPTRTHAPLSPKINQEIEAMSNNKVKWEIYLDAGYYDMWAVRDSIDRSINSPRLFHFATQDDAEKFKALLEVSYCAHGETP